MVVKEFEIVGDFHFIFTQKERSRKTERRGKGC
jgi:hypothetical protein